MGKFFQLTIIIIIISCCVQCSAQENKNAVTTTAEYVKKIDSLPIIVGAQQTAEYLGLLKGKSIGIVANHTSMINNTHLVDSLLNLRIKVKKVFSPEHGFRGKADAGEKVKSDIDAKTGLSIVSLYGKNKKPFPNQVKDLDVIIFDIQDVGARFYTYISTMHYVMEACAENNIKLIVLDRPNPNGHYVDGPVLDTTFRSFIGMHQVPIVHGMTVGEYAKMANGELWLSTQIQCDLTVIKCKNYNHNSFYELPLKPSPNLPNMSAIYLYPSLCLFEGTPISIGRGTEKPFQIIGHPKIKSDEYSFTPKSMEGAKKPKLLNELCYGYNLSDYGNNKMKEKAQLDFSWLIDIYNNYPDKENFFNESFNLLAGNDKLQEQIKNGITEEAIYNSWASDLKGFKIIRKKYLLYLDFE